MATGILRINEKRLNPYSTGSNSNNTLNYENYSNIHVLILILLEVTQMLETAPSERIADVLILILLEVTQIIVKDAIHWENILS